MTACRSISQWGCRNPCDLISMKVLQCVQKNRKIIYIDKLVKGDVEWTKNFQITILISLRRAILFIQILFHFLSDTLYFSDFNLVIDLCVKLMSKYKRKKEAKEQRYAPCLMGMVHFCALKIHETVFQKRYSCLGTNKLFAESYVFILCFVWR